jgi:hypothetical protein
MNSAPTVIHKLAMRARQDFECAGAGCNVFVVSR